MVLVVVRVDYRRDRKVHSEFDQGLSQSSTCPGESGIDHQCAVDEITDRVVITAAESTQQSGDQVVDPNAGDLIDRLRDCGAEGPKGKAATHQREGLPEEKSHPPAKHVVAPGRLSAITNAGTQRGLMVVA